MHLIGNMLYMWIFADNIEDNLGHIKFLIFYLLAGVGAAMTQVLIDTQSQVPMVGASGAIGGVLGAYLINHPNARVLVLIPFGFFYGNSLSIIQKRGAFLFLWINSICFNGP